VALGRHAEAVADLQAALSGGAGDTDTHRDLAAVTAALPPRDPAAESSQATHPVGGRIDD
jgi:hypothetical protein